MSKRWPVLLAAIGVILRIVPIWAQPTWYDENFTVLLARLPLIRLMAATAGDVHPPLWYLICWPFAHIPGLPAWAVVRLPALLAGIAALWVFWGILEWMVASKKVQLLAFGLFCLLPQQIYYAQEGRMYSLLTLLVLVTWLCIMKDRWIWTFVATAAMLYLHNYGLIYAAALWMAGLIYFNNRHDRRILRIRLTLAMAAAGLAFVPWLVVLLRQMDIVGAGYWIMPLSLPKALADLAASYFAVGFIKTQMVNVAVFYGVLAWVLIWSLRKKTLDMPVVYLTFLPFLLAILVSLAWHPVLLNRALVPSGAFLCILLAGPLESLGRRPLLVLSIFFIPALAANLVATAVRAQWADDPIYRDQAAIALIDSRWQPGDRLYSADDGYLMTATIYARNIDNALRVEPCGIIRGGLTAQTRAALGIVTGLPSSGDRRTWAITAETPLNTGCENEILQAAGLLDGDPLYCPQDNELVKSCVYLEEGK